MRQVLGVALLAALSAPFTFAAYRPGVSVGVTAGVPLLDLFDTANSLPRFNYVQLTNRYIIGPSIEFRLPHRFAIQAEGLYTHGSYNSTLTSGNTVTGTRTTADFWSVPVMLKYRVFDNAGIAPFIEGGASFRYVGNTNTTQSTLASIPIGSQTININNPLELTNRFTSGFVAGGGVDFHASFLHIAPELRYTRWGWENFQQGLFHSNLNQVDFLVGIRF